MKISVVPSSKAFKLTSKQNACLMAWVLSYFCSKIAPKLPAKKTQVAWFNALCYSWADGFSDDFLDRLSSKAICRFLKGALPANTPMRIDTFQHFVEFLEWPHSTQMKDSLLKKLCSSGTLAKAVFDLPKYAAAELLMCAGEDISTDDTFDSQEVKEAFDLGCHFWHFKQTVNSVEAEKVYHEDICGKDTYAFWDGYNVSGILNDRQFKKYFSINQE
jgi:hypothetical protein